MRGGTYCGKQKVSLSTREGMGIRNLKGRRVLDFGIWMMRVVSGE